MNFTFLQNYDDMSKAAAEFVAKEINSRNGEKFVLGLPTGSSPEGMYDNLIKMNKNNEVDFENVWTYNLDEYYPITQNHEQSYYTFMYKTFFNHININKANINIPFSKDGNIIAGIKYETYIDADGGIDLMILGIGANGHIGFNEPKEVLKFGTHITDLTEETINANARFFASADEVPKQAISMGMGSIIIKSRKILLIVAGDSKIDVLKKLLKGGISTLNPASLLWLHPDVTVLVDRLQKDI